MSRPAMDILAACFLLVFVSSLYGVDRSILFYQIGEGDQADWAYLKQYFETRGYSVTVAKGETEIARHVEKINRINHGRYGIFVALQLISGEKRTVIVAEPVARKAGGRFTAVEEVPSLFAAQSGRLAASVAGSFNVRVKHLPLFPLLGVDMPGLFVRIGGEREELRNEIGRLCTGVDKYLIERAGE